MKRLLTIALSLIILTGIVVFINKPTSEPIPKKQKSTRFLTAKEIRQAEIAHKVARRAAGYAKPNKPDEFMKYHKLIRTNYGDPAPTYGPDYKLKALRKSIALKKQLKSTSKVLNWIERGPGNVSGRTRGLIIDPDDESTNTWFCGSVGGGIWKTTDAGQSWRNLTPNLPNLSTVSIAMAPSNHNVIYAGTGEGFGNGDAIAGDGILKSTDRGETWQQLTSTTGNENFKYVNRLVVNSMDENTVIAVTNTGIYKSNDGGISWDEKFNDGDRVQHIIEHPSNFDILYASVEYTGVLRSVDAGETWEYVHSDSVGRIELAISPSDPQQVYALNEDSELFISKDGGDTWSSSKITEGSTEEFLSGQGWYDNAITVTPADPNTLFIGGVEIFRVKLIGEEAETGIQQLRSTRLTSWNGSNKPYVHADVHNIQLTTKVGNPYRIIVANDGGVAYSDNNGISWTNPLKGYNTTQFYGVDKHPTVNRYIGGTQDNGTWMSSSDPTHSSAWAEATGGDGFDVVWHSKEPEKIIATIYNNRLYRLNGGDWETISDEITDKRSNAPFITQIANNPNSPDRLYVIGKSGVTRSFDFGTSWELTPISNLWGFNDDYDEGQVAISESNPEIVWAAVGHNSNEQRIQVSVDGGKTFSATNTYAKDMGAISGLATHPTKPNTAFALFSGEGEPKILRTDDLGESWRDISGFDIPSNGFPDVAVYDLLVMPHNPDELWAGTEIGLFISSDDGSTWQYADNGLPAVSIWEIKVRGEQVVVATHGRGIWSVTIDELNNRVQPPCLAHAGMSVKGEIALNYAFPSLYDSTIVVYHETERYRIDGNSITVDNDWYSFEKLYSATIQSVQLISYKDGISYYSEKKDFKPFDVSEAATSYSNDLEDTGLRSDFVGEHFTVSNDSSLGNHAIHTPHPYVDMMDISYQLKTPIIVTPRAKDGKAILRYVDIPMIEEGETGTSYNDEEFWDYVIVEGSKNGVDWLPLADGYDFGLIKAKAPQISISDEPFSGLFTEHRVDLLDTFNENDTIFIRFRLFSDFNTIGWGWVIDEIEIQRDMFTNTEIAKSPEYNVYPNPFRASINIVPGAEIKGTTRVVCYNLSGQKVLQKSVDALPELPFVVHTHNLRPGTYIIDIENNGLHKRQKIQKIE